MTSNYGKEFRFLKHDEIYGDNKLDLFKSYVNKDNLEIVRDFVGNLGQEFVSVFDSIWCSGNDDRLEIIAEMKMNQKVKKL